MKIKTIPNDGLTAEQLTETALREATTELRGVIELVQGALAKVIYPDNPDRYLPLKAIYPDRAVVELDGHLYSYPYQISDDNTVMLGERTEVVLDHRPVRMAEAVQGAFIEALDDKESGHRWKIRVIKAGKSKNNNYYPDAVLREAAPMFNGARVFVKADEEHLKGGGKSFNQLIGRLVEAEFVSGKGKDSGEIQATLELLSTTDDVATKIREAWSRGMADLFGFSIDALAKSRRIKHGNVLLREATKITKVSSVDLIIEPGAGGQIIQLLEAENADDKQETVNMKLKERMLNAIREAHDGKLPDNLDTEDADAIETAYREAIEPAGGGKPDDAVREAIRMVEARVYARDTIRNSGLPDPAQEKLLAQFKNRDFREPDVDAAITAEREYLGQFTESGHVTGLGHFEPGEDRADKLNDMFDAFFDPKHKDHRNVRSFKECYIEITGDKRVTGHFKDCDLSRMSESLGVMREALDSSSFANVLGDSITRRMVAMYAERSQYDVWRRIASTTPVNDFRTQERTRFGGYGDLPVVAESDAYAALTSPTDEKASYAVAKRGGTEKVTLEMIKNDDVGAIQRIPTKLTQAAKRTLGKFVLDFIVNNPVIYDGNALFHIAHNNLGTAALDSTALAAGRLAMLQQTEKDSGERLSIPPSTLLVPYELEETAFDLFRRQTNNDTDFIESLQMQVLPVWYWTDANDWALAANPQEIPTIEIGFLDGNEEPEIFVQDSPTVGSLFSNDQITYKIRHVYGGNVLDYRGLYKSVVA